MKRFNLKARREITLMAIISGIAVAPLLFIGFGRAWGPRPAPVASFTPVKPLIERLSLGKTSYLPSPAWLSPDGRFIARMEISEAETGDQAPGALTPRLDEIVIRSARNGREVFRQIAGGQFVSWIPNSNAFVAQYGLDVSVFTPATRKVRNPLPGQLPAPLWKAASISFSERGLDANNFLSSNGSGLLDSQNGAIRYSPDFRFAVKAAWNDGDVWWEVADLFTLKMAKPVKAGRWLDAKNAWQPRIDICVAPSSLARGKMPLVALMQTTQLTPSSTATPTPQPTATPVPTASPAQTRFLSEAKREEDAVQKLVESVLGVDGAEPRITDAAEVARIEAEVKRRNLALRTAREKLFPTPKAVEPSKSALLSQARPYQIECFDLSLAKPLWKVPIHNQMFKPVAVFSPDGAVVVAWNTSRVFAKNYSPDQSVLQDTGFDFFAAKTGQKRAEFRLYESEFGIPDPSQAVFTRQIASDGKLHSILTFLDSRSIRETIPAPDGNNEIISTRLIPVLRFFDTTTARETSHLDVEMRRFARNFNLSTLSSDDNGLSWLLGEGDYQLTSRAQLGTEVFSPLIQPTPVPTPTPTPQ